MISDDEVIARLARELYEIKKKLETIRVLATHIRDSYSHPHIRITIADIIDEIDGREVSNED